MLEFFPNTGDRLLLVYGQSSLGVIDGPASSAESCAIVNPRLPFLASREAPLDRTRLAGPGAVQCNSSRYPRHLGQSVKEGRMSGDRNSSNQARRDNPIATGDSCASAGIASLNGRPLLPNVGIPLDLNWVQEVRVNTSAVERRTQSQVARRTVKKEWQAAWLLRALSCMDLTTLSGDDTDERVRRLCAKATHPIQQELVEKLGIADLGVKVAAVCVYHT